MFSFFTMVLGNVLLHIFQYVPNRSQFSRNKNESFKPKLSQFQETFSTGLNYQFLVQLSYFKNVFSTILTTIWHIQPFLIP